MASGWWEREDVTRCVQSFYDILQGTTFTNVGRRFMGFTVVDNDISRVISMFKPFRYLGFGLCGWPNPQSVFNEASVFTRIDFDLDDLPHSHNDLLTLLKWSEERGLDYLVYFTGSRGYRVCFGKADIELRKASKKVSMLREMLKIWSLDLVPYRIGIAGWSQSPGTLHRKSSLPAFILEKPPARYFDIFKEAIAILEGREELKVHGRPLDGNKLIKSIDEAFDALKDEEKKRMETRAISFLRKRISVPLYYQTPLYYPPP